MSPSQVVSPPPADAFSLFAPQCPDDRRCAECDKDKTKVSGWRASKLKPGDWLCQPCAKREVMHIHFHSLAGDFRFRDILSSGRFTPLSSRSFAGARRTDLCEVRVR